MQRTPTAGDDAKPGKDDATEAAPRKPPKVPDPVYVEGKRVCLRCLLGASKGAGGKHYSHDRGAPVCVLYQSQARGGAARKLLQEAASAPDAPQVRRSRVPERTECQQGTLCRGCQGAQATKSPTTPSGTSWTGTAKTKAERRRSSWRRRRRTQQDRVQKQPPPTGTPNAGQHLRGTDPRKAGAALAEPRILASTSSSSRGSGDPVQEQAMRAQAVAQRKAVEKHSDRGPKHFASPALKLAITEGPSTVAPQKPGWVLGTTRPAEPATPPRAERHDKASPSR